MSKPILCLDFDGVIHSYSSGWKGADVIPDPPVAGAIDFIVRSLEHFKVTIYSSRSGQKDGIYAMRKWLRRHWLEGGFAGDLEMQIEWPTEKPAAFITIVDRALTFDGTWPDIEALKQFQPWNKRSVARAPQPSDRAAVIEEWCQPKDRGKPTPRKFLLYFDDPDHGNSVFDDEVEAREAFAKASLAWNCYLFGALATSPPAQASPSPDGWRDIETAPKDRMFIWAWFSEGRWKIGLAYQNVSGKWSDAYALDAPQYATHWTDLPAPPSRDAEESK